MKVYIAIINDEPIGVFSSAEKAEQKLKIFSPNNKTTVMQCDIDGEEDAEYVKVPAHWS